MKFTLLPHDEFPELPIALPDPTNPEEQCHEIQLGSGTITGLLGKGGMSHVYEIWNKDLEVHRAVKLMLPTTTDIDRQRFETEIKLSAKLQHPSIVEIHGVGKWNGLSYLEMEKLGGKSLKTILEESGALPCGVCISLGIMLASALHYLHTVEFSFNGSMYHGIIHRDLKPSNIMICTNGRVKIMDLGIARPIDLSLHTIDGTVVGTIQYLPPEMLQGEKIDIRTDIYAFGVTLYEAITGTKAFPDINMSKLISVKTKNKYKPLQEFELDLPKEFVETIHSCMHHHKDKRIPDAATVLQIFESLHERYTNQKPEFVIKEYFDTKQPEPVIVALKPPTTLKKTVLTIFICIILGILALILFNNPRFIVYLLNSSDHPQAARVQNNTNTIQLVAYQRETVPEENRKRLTQETIPTKAASQKLSQKPKVAPSNNQGQTLSSQKSVLRQTDSSHANLLESEVTQTLLDTLHSLVTRNSFEQATIHYYSLPQQVRQTPQAVIYMARALRNIGTIQRLNDFLASHEIIDGEYFLFKALVELQLDHTTQAYEYLNRAHMTPACAMNPIVLKQEIAYLKALVSHEAFKKDSSLHNLQIARHSWKTLYNLLWINKEHPYFKQSEQELKQLQGLGH